MQTLGQRLVWAARADLALARGDPGLALDITERLIASAANLSSERIIPHLWKLRAEVLAALGRGAEAEGELRVAQEAAHAQGLRPLLWRISLTQGKLAHAQRRYEEADRRFAEALEMIENLASSLPGETFHQRFLHHARLVAPGLGRRREADGEGCESGDQAVELRQGRLPPPRGATTIKSSPGSRYARHK